MGRKWSPSRIALNLTSERSADAGGRQEDRSGSIWGDGVGDDGGDVKEKRERMRHTGIRFDIVSLRRVAFYQS
jgi:hypothetical protein